MGGRPRGEGPVTMSWWSCLMVTERLQLVPRCSRAQTAKSSPAAVMAAPSQKAHALWGSNCQESHETGILGHDIRTMAPRKTTARTIRDNTGSRRLVALVPAALTCQ